MTDLAKALDLSRGFLTRYVAFPSEHEPVAVALWIAQTYLLERFETSPILAVTSAEKRSGKTLLLDCLELLVPSPFRAIIPSEAVTYTVLSQRPRRTMLLDEADAIFGTRTAERYEGLRAILNAGNRRGTPVLRVKFEGRRREVDEFDVFGPKAVAGIGKLPDTVTDRAIPIRMKRRAPGESVERFRLRSAERAAIPIREWLEALPEVIDSLVLDVPIPEELHDRAADGWEPLLAIADAAGSDWGGRARLAAVALAGEEAIDLSVGIRLLADIRDAFTGLDHVATADLLRYLHAIEDAPWSEWYGKPLSGRGLARLLEPYGVFPQQRRVSGGDIVRGYFRRDLADAWQRYLPSEPGTSGTGGTLVPESPRGVPGVPDVPLSQEQEPLAAANGYIPCVTCGASPTGTFLDGSPKYSCGPHPPVYPEALPPSTERQERPL
jgi:hypothetical protein